MHQPDTHSLKHVFILMACSYGPRGLGCFRRFHLTLGFYSFRHVCHSNYTYAKKRYIFVIFDQSSPVWQVANGIRVLSYMCSGQLTTMNKC